MNVSMDNIAEKVFDNFKKITPGLIAIALFSGMLLFLPVSILEKMSLNDLPILWQRIIGIIFMMSVALIVTIVCSSVYFEIASKRKAKRMKNTLKKKYQMLSIEHKKIIKELLMSQDKTIALEQNSGDVVYLVNNLFLHMPQQLVSVGWNNQVIVKYTPQPWLLELYNEEPELFNQL